MEGNVIVISNPENMHKLSKLKLPFNFWQNISEHCQKLPLFEMEQPMILQLRKWLVLRYSNILNWRREKKMEEKNNKKKKKFN